MKKGLTELVFILDKSGSMQGLEDDTIGGFNSMLTRQKEKAEEVLVSTIFFNNASSVVHDRESIDEVCLLEKDDFIVGGATALIDAIGGAVHHIKNVHKYIRKEDCPEKVMFVIMTDGMENASHRYSLNQVKKEIEHLKKKRNWEFLFLGANIDAFETAKGFGISKETTVDFRCDSVGTQLNYEVLSETVEHFCVQSPLRLDSSWKSRIEEDYKNRA